MTPRRQRDLLPALFVYLCAAILVASILYWRTL